MKMEFPPYQFYKSGSTKKLCTRPIPLTSHACSIRLHSMIFSPEDVRQKLILKIEFVEGKRIPTIEMHSSTLFYNPVHKSTLFFRSQQNDFTDIVLPSGHKKVKYSVLCADEAVDLVVSLNCMYIKVTDKKPDRYAIEDFDLLKKNKIILDLCDRCIEAEGHNDIWGSTYSDLFKEIEVVIHKKIVLCDLPDELIEFRRHTKLN